MRTVAFKTVLVAGLALSAFAGPVLAGEFPAQDKQETAKGEDAYSNQTIRFFVSDIGVMTDEEFAEVKKNLMMELRKTKTSKKDTLPPRG